MEFICAAGSRAEGQGYPSLWEPMRESPSCILDHGHGAEGFGVFPARFLSCFHLLSLIYFLPTFWNRNVYPVPLCVGSITSFLVL